MNIQQTITAKAQKDLFIVFSKIGLKDIQLKNKNGGINILLSGKSCQTELVEAGLIYYLIGFDKLSLTDNLK